MLLKPSPVTICKLHSEIQKNVRWNKDGSMELKKTDRKETYEAISSKLFQYK